MFQISNVFKRNRLGWLDDNVKYVIYRDSILTEEQYLTVEQCLSRIYGVGKGVHN